jgi:dynein heavy chain 2, cytosolic
MFPRFYFIGDDDLLEILGQATNPIVIQTHLKKLFAGIHSVQFDNDNQHILAMRSLDGELVPLTKKIRMTDAVEEWLRELSTAMITTLQQSLVNVLQESRKQLGHSPIDKYPSQVSECDPFRFIVVCSCLDTLSS